MQIPHIPAIFAPNLQNSHTKTIVYESTHIGVPALIRTNRVGDFQLAAVHHPRL
jgi:hypothetical protein